MSYQYHVKKVVTGNDETWEVGVNCIEILYQDRHDVSSFVTVFTEQPDTRNEWMNWHARFPFSTVKGVYKDVQY